MSKVIDLRKRKKGKSLAPHIKLDRLEKGLFPQERIGYFLDYDKRVQCLEMQTCNSNFTKQGLLEVEILETKDDKVLIEVYSECYPVNHIIKKDNLRYLDKTELEYVKN